MKKLILYMFLCMMALGAAAQAVSGDVNGDGTVNISDVNAIIAIVLDGHGVNPEADLNGDGTVNISDVNLVIDEILAGSGNNPAVDVNGDGNVNISDINAIIAIILK